jgi:hypothetical protein
MIAGGFAQPRFTSTVRGANRLYAAIWKTTCPKRQLRCRASRRQSLACPLHLGPERTLFLSTGRAKNDFLEN